MKPILFNTEMVQAISEGRKTVTRRLVKPQHLQVLDSPYHNEHPKVPDEVLIEKLCEPPYHPGDILYVRETWHKDVGRYMYRADYSDTEKFCRNGKEVCIKWSPSIHMPKEAARLFLRVTDVWVERLRDIGDCTKEGVPRGGHATAHMNDYDERCYFRALWNSTIKPADRDRYGWDANPWVWVIEFERISRKAALSVEGGTNAESV